MAETSPSKKSLFKKLKSIVDTLEPASLQVSQAICSAELVSTAKTVFAKLRKARII
jgi:hypothetical protein